MKPTTSNFNLKFIFSALMLCCSINILWGQAPQQFSYQTVVRNNTGAIVAQQNVAFRISIIPTNPANQPLYTETQSITTNDFGLATLAIGNGTVVFGSIASINWSTGVFFLEIEIDPQGGSNWQLMGSSQLLSVPYALYAEQTSATSNDFDKDSTNELQTISLSNDSIKLSKGGGAVQPSINNLSDVQLQQPQNGEVLQFNGTAWSNVPLCNLGQYYYRDADGDGLGNAFQPVFVLAGCNAPLGFVSNANDCDDTDSNTGIVVWYADNDNDTYGNPNDSIVSCTQPSGYVLNNLDCNDNNPSLPTTWYADLDSDGFGDASTTIVACSQPSGYVSVAGDCDDNNPNVSPGQTEICNNGIDDNCDGTIDCFDSDCINFSACNPCFLNPCDDGLPCTTDVCNLTSGGVSCTYTLDANTCFINGQCIAAGTTNPFAPCEECNPSFSQSIWSPKLDGTACIDGNPCTRNDVCFNGVCTPTQFLECGIGTEDGNTTNCGTCGSGLICDGNNNCVPQ